MAHHNYKGKHIENRKWQNQAPFAVLVQHPYTYNKFLNKIM